MRDRCIHPTTIPRRDRAPKCGAAALIDEANDGVAIDGRGHGLPKFHIAKPFLFSREIRGRLFAEVVQVEEEEIVFETWAGVGHGVAALLAGENGKILCARGG